MRSISNSQSVISELLVSVLDDPIPIRVQVVAEEAVAHVATALIDVLVVLAQLDVLLFAGLLLDIHLHVLESGQLGEVALLLEPLVWGVTRVAGLVLGIGAGMREVVKGLVRGKRDWLVQGVVGRGLVQVSVGILMCLWDCWMPRHHVLG
jgi:hypothetical protein